MGWVWDSANHRVIGWWAILGIGNLILALGLLLMWRPAIKMMSVWAGTFGLVWLGWAIGYIVKTGRLENPEPYLYVVPAMFVAAYVGVVGCAVRLLRLREDAAAVGRSSV